MTPAPRGHSRNQVRPSRAIRVPESVIVESSTAETTIPDSSGRDGPGLMSMSEKYQPPPAMPATARTRRIAPAQRNTVGLRVVRYSLARFTRAPSWISF